MHSIETLRRLNSRAVPVRKPETPPDAAPDFVPVSASHDGTQHSYRLYVGLTSADRLQSWDPETAELEAWHRVLEPAGVSGATFTTAYGRWKGARERSLVVEVWSSSSRLPRRLARGLADLLRQESVGIVHPDGGTELVEGSPN